MKKIKQIFKTFYTNIRSWGWYEWLKYILAGFMCVLAVILTVTMFYVAITDADTTFSLFMVGLFFLPFEVLPLLAGAWLIIKDYRLVYIPILTLCIFGIFWSLESFGVYYTTYPRLSDVVDFAIIAASVVCLLKITFDKRIKNKSDNSKLSKISIFVVFAWIIMSLLGLAAAQVVPDDDGEFDLATAKECITKKIEEGYPREFARQYCVESSLGCLGRKYKEDCDPEVFCCFKTVEEDKKWNYLDYDEQGNKIKK